MKVDPAFSESDATRNVRWILAPPRPPGLVVRPIDASETSWLRVGFYGMCWSYEDYGDQIAPPRYFGDLETITLV